MSCYMCNEDATSVEHVPPRCLFPEKKDLPYGVDLRQHLITVPACNAYNTEKSKDDEYLLYSLVISIPTGEVGKDHFQSKILRAVKRNPSLIKLLMKNKQAVVVVDEKTRELQKTIALKIDSNRIDSALEHISRGIYFNHFKEKWLEEITTQAEFLLTSLDPLNGKELNEDASKLANATDVAFNGAKFHGKNKEVFKYQVIDGKDFAHKLMRFYFYEGCKVTSFFGVNN